MRGQLGSAEPVLREAGPWIVDALAERSRRSPGQRPAQFVATETDVLTVRDQLVGISCSSKKKVEEKKILKGEGRKRQLRPFSPL